MKTILIVDDQPLIQNHFSLILDKLGYSSIIADDGLEAFEKTELHKVDLIFMDLQMPIMNGYEAAENLRKRNFKKPIIAVTASDYSEEKEKCIRAGFDDIMIKPVKKIDIENQRILVSVSNGDELHTGYVGLGKNFDTIEWVVE